MDALYKEMRKRNIPFENRTEFFTHINHLHGDILEWIRKFKPYQVSVGVESGDDRMLQAMDKGFDSQTAYEVKATPDILGSVGTLFLIDSRNRREFTEHPSFHRTNKAFCRGVGELLSARRWN
jgi:hypothetical protein